MTPAARSPFFVSVAYRVSLDVISRGAFILITILAARKLGVGPYGEFVYALALAQMLYPLTDLGTNLLLIKEVGENRHRNERIWVDYFQLRIALILAAFALFAALIFGGRFWSHPQLLLLGYVWMAGNSMLDLNQSICNGLNRLDIAMVVVAIQRGCLITGGIVALLMHPEPLMFMATIAAASVLGVAGSSIYLFRSLNCSLSDHFHLAEWIRILRTGFPNAVSGTFGAWYLRIGFVLLAWFASAAQVGEYSAAFRIFEAIYILPAATMSMAVPHLAAARMSGAGIFLSELRRIGLSMFALGALTAFALWGLSDLIVVRLFGPSFQGAVPVLKTFAGVAFVVFLNYFVTHVMVVVNRQKRHALNQALSLMAGIALSIYLIPAHYSLGAAYALLGTEVVLFVLTITTLVHRWKEA